MKKKGFVSYAPGRQDNITSGLTQKGHKVK